MPDYSDMPDTQAADRELTERAKVASDRAGDVQTLRDNLDELEAFYRGVVWQEAGGKSMRHPEHAKRAAEALKLNAEVFIEDLEKRIDGDRR